MNHLDTNYKECIAKMRAILDSMGNEGYNSINRKLNDIENNICELFDLYEHAKTYNFETHECTHCTKATFKKE